MPRSLLGLLGSIFVLASGVLSAFASTHPPGRAWSPEETLHAPELAALASELLVRIAADGSPEVLMTARRDDGGLAWTSLAWTGTGWSASYAAPLTANMGPICANNAPDMGQQLLWTSSVLDRNGYTRLLTASLTDHEVAPPETVAVTTTQGSSFAMGSAISPGHRWVVRVDQPPSESSQLHTYWSSAGGPWLEAPRIGTDRFNCAVAPLDDGRALVVHAGWTGAGWAVLQDGRWVDRGELPTGSRAFRFFRSEDGAWHMVVEDAAHALHVDRWTGGGFVREATLVPARDPGRGFVNVAWVSVEWGAKERPTIAWLEGWSEGPIWWTERHVAFPTSSGWSPGWQASTRENVFLGPWVTRDDNGEAWMVWFDRGDPLPHFSHSYVTAKPTAPTLASTPDGVRVAWEIDPPAPNSRWAVMRSESGGSFHEIGRVDANEGVSLTWTDPAPPAGDLRYFIRRPHRDVRYTFDGAASPSFVTSAPLAGAGALRLAALRNPAGPRLALELRGASAGDVDLRAFDVSGRQVARRRAHAAGGPTQPVSLDLGAAPAGVYLVTARDASGHVSPALRVVRLQ